MRHSPMKQKSSMPLWQWSRRKRNVDGDQIAPFVKKYRRGLEWWFARSTTAKCSSPPAKHPLYSIARHAATTKEEFQCLQAQSLQQPQDVQHSQLQGFWHPQLQNFQHSWSQSFDILGWYTEQIHQRRKWEEKMERLNGLDYYSSSESESDWKEEPKYETLVWRLLNSLHSRNFKVHVRFILN